uniref:VTT domain-containing protein n=1 Tax=Helicotheca tamesis TaxID=374047 RepID=A0A7S2GPD0_9STRA|mmetsp:Transcript_10030/g.14059  ORF Transcript_10030/g.14059 Transcript_10030/m.14059 type:complete len:196 (+) Transcript_10030:3-590(+)
MGLGIYLATISCFIGCCLGAIFAFVRARYMMRDLIKLFAGRYPMIRKFDTALKEKGFRIMLLLRLSVIVPFNALNYIGGVTGVTLSSFIASLIGLVPQILFTVFVGATAGDLQQRKLNGEHEVVRDVLLGLGVGFAALALLSIWRLAKMELHENEDDDYEDLVDNPSIKVETQSARTESSNEDEEDNEEWFWVWT